MPTDAKPGAVVRIVYPNRVIGTRNVLEVNAPERVVFTYDYDIAAARMHMPLSLARASESRQCQGMALCDWTASSPDGTVRARGTNVFELARDGRIHRVTGFWAS